MTWIGPIGAISGLMFAIQPAKPVLVVRRWGFQGMKPPRSRYRTGFEMRLYLT